MSAEVKQLLRETRPISSKAIQVVKERSCPCILFIDKLTYVTFNVFTSFYYNGISQ